MIVGALELARNNPAAAQEALERAYELGSDDITSSDLAIIDGIINAICSKDFISDDDMDTLDHYVSEVKKVDSDRADKLWTGILSRLKNRR
jgi:hypothetical protein